MGFGTAQNCDGPEYPQHSIGPFGTVDLKIVYLGDSGQKKNPTSRSAEGIPPRPKSYFHPFGTSANAPSDNKSVLLVMFTYCFSLPSYRRHRPPVMPPTPK